MKLPKYSQWKFGVVLGLGALIALVLCVQCVRTYLYMDSVLVPQQAEREAGRQVGALTAAARSAGITDPRALSPVIERVMESSSDRVLWMRILDPHSNVLAQGGNPQRTAKIPPRWWERVQRHESLGVLIDTPEGKALVVMLPFRLQGLHGPRLGSPNSHVRPPHERHAPSILELAISLKAVAGSFEGLRQNLIVGLIAAIALLLSLGVIGLRAPHYFRGKHLENELQLARLVQSDLQPKPHSVSPRVEFAASAVASDHVGGDFYDVFEAESGKIAIVLGDVSGKGVAAALLVSVLQGAIRSSTAHRHESACERMNRMLCERTACERFATLFWGVFDPSAGTLRYVNAGHAAPILIRHGKDVIRLDQGGPVLGLLPEARYSAETVEIEDTDTLVLYSDGISEATNRNDEEFGEDRLENLIGSALHEAPAELCQRIMTQVGAHTSSDVPQDDRTLLVVKFSPSGEALEYASSARIDSVAIA